MEDVVAVIRDIGRENAIIVGHDWGGAIAWQLAIHRPDVVNKLIVCNMTHPMGKSKEGLKTLQANGNKSYMDDFRKHTAETLPITWLAGWVKDAEAKKHYEKAFARSYVDGMINFYKANTPTKEQRAAWLKNPVIKELPKVKMPVLAVFGTQDKYVLKEGLNNTWDWLEKDFTLVTLPQAGHFVQQDASEMLSKSMKMWLLRDK
jgi:pimeloyl-ACP methyl ester carboxylesterase